MDIDLSDVAVSAIINESSIEEKTLQCYEELVTSERTYHIITNGSQKGKEKLADNDGYTYTVKTQRANGNKTWTCSVRNKSMWCKATVLQKGSSFTHGTQPHIHPSKVGAALATRIAAEVKERAANEVFTSAAEIVNNVLLIEGVHEAAEPLDALQKPANLARAANRHRHKKRPAEPKDMDFEIDTNHIPANFLRKDIHVDGKRHLIFATDEMLELLSKSKIWYMDGTFKVVKDPFCQLMTIHSFVHSGEDVKQVPLLFVLMSARRKKDYRKVLKAVKKLTEVQRVTQMVLDFERAVWNAIPHVFPDVTIRGCAFHWSQCTWRKIQELGLSPAYVNDNETQKFCRQLLALPYLPHEHIQPVFTHLEQKSSTDQLKQLTDYIRNYWIEENLWKPVTWSVFKQLVRTNKDVEGWHAALDRRARRGNITFYLLVKFLREQADIVNMQVRLVSAHKLQRRQQRQYRQMQEQLNALWNSYIAGEKSARQLLRKCAHLVSPNVD